MSDLEIIGRLLERAGILLLILSIGLNWANWLYWRVRAWLYIRKVYRE